MSLVEISAAGDKELDVERAVRERYSAASREREPALCCPVVYETQFLEVLGFTEHQVNFHKQQAFGHWHEMYTIVATRPS